MPNWQQMERKLEKYRMTDFQKRVLKVTFEIPKVKYLPTNRLQKGLETRTRRGQWAP
jgi:hypothetical protein